MLFQKKKFLNSLQISECRWARGTSPMAQQSKACNAGDRGGTGLIPGSGRSFEEGNGNLLQYFMDGRAWKDTVQRSAVVDMTERLTTHTTGGLEEENF